jgi:hypothetical protein
LEDGASVLLVVHDGDWQFLCGGDHSEQGPILLHLEHLLERDPSLNELADLMCGHRAERSEPGQPWTIVDDSMDRFNADIAEYGWHVIGVFASDDEPAFSYSIGMTETLDHPEIIVVGLSLDLMHRMINDLGARIRSGESIKPGQPIVDVLEDAVCIMHLVAKHHLREYLGYAYRHYGGASFEALQCFWPGKVSGRFPWEPKSGVREIQVDLR